MTDRVAVRTALWRLSRDHLDVDVAQELAESFATAERVLMHDEPVVLLTDTVVGEVLCLALVTPVRIIVLDADGSLVDMVWRHDLTSVLRDAGEDGSFDLRLFHVGGELLLADVGDEQWADQIGIELTDEQRWANLRLDEPAAGYEAPPEPPTAEERWAEVTDPSTAFVCQQCGAEYTAAFRGGACSDCAGWVIDRQGRIH